MESKRMNPPTLEQVEQELKSISQEMASLRNRTAGLLKYREALTGLIPRNSKAKSVMAAPAPPCPEKKARGRVNATLDLAHAILSEGESLGTMRLVRRMREAGWAGSADDAKDFQRINKMLIRRRDKFISPERGVWKAVIPKDSAKASAE